MLAVVVLGEVSGTVRWGGTAGVVVSEDREEEAVDAVVLAVVVVVDVVEVVEEEEGKEGRRSVDVGWESSFSARARAGEKELG